MRFTYKLNAQHLGWMFKKHWETHGKCIPRSSGAETELEKLAIGIQNVENVLKNERQLARYGNDPSVSPGNKKNLVLDEEFRYIYDYKKVLLEGIPQAQILTNTLEINAFPQKIVDFIDKIQIPTSVDKYIQKYIIGAQILDSEQVKLPKIKNTDYLNQNLPRTYGTSSKRRNQIITSKLLAECERLAGHSLASQRKIIDNTKFQVTLSRKEDKFQFSVTVDKMLVAKRPLHEIKGSYNGQLPDLYPMKCTINIPKQNLLSVDNLYPLSSQISCYQPHTIIQYFDDEIGNSLHGTSVTSTQMQSRTFLNAFCVAAARAQQLYGNSICKKRLDKPIVVQSVQTNGRIFHFGVLQLNTLALTSSETDKNYWFHQPNMELFHEDAYKDYKSMIKGYSSDVFRFLYAFYNSV